MTPFEIGLLSLGAMVFLVYAGLWVPFALMLTSFLGVWAIRDSSDLAANLLALAASEAVSSYFFGVVPIFVLMGYLVAESGMGRDAFILVNHAFRRLIGGLGVGTVGASAIFAAITGISIASAAVFTRVAVPEMRKSGYADRFSLGIVAGASVLGMLIPPSLLLILYALLAEQSVGAMFMGGVLPGVTLAIIYAIGVILLVRFFPAFTGPIRRPKTGDRLGIGGFLGKGGPIGGLIVLVLGGIYMGWFTPIEAGAVGTVGAFAVGLANRSLSASVCWRILRDTGLVTASVCFLIIAAQMYSRMLALSGVPAGFGEFVAASGFGVWGVLLLYCAVVIVMGTILDSASIMLILVPLMVPVVDAMGVDLIWFGIVTVIAVEIGLLTPPFGMSVFVIKSAMAEDEITVGQIFAGAAPFVGMMLIALGLVLALPSLVTALL